MNFLPQTKNRLGFSLSDSLATSVNTIETTLADTTESLVNQAVDSAITELEDFTGYELSPEEVIQQDENIQSSEIEPNFEPVIIQNETMTSNEIMGMNKNLVYIGGGLLVLVIVIFMMSKKKGKKK